MAYIGKTNWQNNEIVEAVDMNRIEQGITDIQNATTTHLADTMPHRFVDGGKTYRWGLSVVNGVVMFNYEEVV